MTGHNKRSTMYDFSGLLCQAFSIETIKIKLNDLQKFCTYVSTYNTYVYMYST